MKTITFLSICIFIFGCQTSTKNNTIITENGTNNTTVTENQTSSTQQNTSTKNNTDVSSGSNTNNSNSNSNSSTSSNSSSNTSSNTNNSNSNTGSNNSSNTSSNTNNSNSSNSSSTNTSNSSKVVTKDNSKTLQQIEQEASAIRKIYQSFGSSSIPPTKALENFDFQKHLRFLVEKNAQDDRGYNMLMLACERGYTYTVKSILAINQQSSYVNHQSSDGGKTALMLAANNNSREVVKMLLLSGANPQITRDNGKKAVDFAKDDEIIGMLQGIQRY